MSDIEFPVKTIQWSAYEQQSPILLQQENGPCPLIALVNTLILSSDIHARSDQIQSSRLVPDITELRRVLNHHAGSTVAIAEILSSIGEALLSVSELEPGVVNDFLEYLPLLHTGLDVNPNLVTGDFNPEDLATQIFNAFGLNFLHGWCRSLSGEPTVDEVFSKHKTFDALQEYLLSQLEESVERQAVKLWLDETGTQLTQEGLALIDSKMAPDSLAIFFRNNHFLTLYKAQNHDLYLLIADNAFLKRASYVWQSLNSVSGSDDLYFTGDFTPLLDGDDLQQPLEISEDLRVARELQEQEDFAMAQEMQERHKSKHQQNRTPLQERNVDEMPQNVVLSAQQKRQLRWRQLSAKQRAQHSSQEAVGVSEAKKRDGCTIM